MLYVLFVVKGLPRRGDWELSGARSLEGLNLRVDSRSKKLVAGGPIPVAARKGVQEVPVPPICWWTEQGGGGIILGLGTPALVTPLELLEKDHENET